MARESVVEGPRVGARALPENDLEARWTAWLTIEDQRDGGVLPPDRRKRRDPMARYLKKGRDADAIAEDDAKVRVTVEGALAEIRRSGATPPCARCP
jgi:hypothetical protein